MSLIGNSSQPSLRINSIRINLINSYVGYNQNVGMVHNNNQNHKVNYVRELLSHDLFVYSYCEQPIDFIEYLITCHIALYISIDIYTKI